MKIFLKVESLAVKGKIEKDGELSKQLSIRATIPYNGETESFLSGHLCETLLAYVDPAQFDFFKEERKEPPVGVSLNLGQAPGPGRPIPPGDPELKIGEEGKE